MILYIFGAGHGSVEIMEDSRYWLGEYTRDFEQKILVEDLPKNSNIQSTDSVINLVQYGIISAYYPEWKEVLDKTFTEVQWVSAISPRANVLLAQKPVGINVRSGAFIGSTVKIGRHVRVNFGANLSYGCEVGDYSFIGINTSMCAGAKVGKSSLIYSHSVILNDVKVGDRSIIGAGSVVTKDIGDGVIAFGNPCKVVRENEWGWLKEGSK